MAKANQTATVKKNGAIIQFNAWHVLAIEKALKHFRECQPGKIHDLSLADLIEKIEEA